MSLPWITLSWLNSHEVQDYVVQQTRFQVEEGFGCTNGPDGSVLDMLLINFWTVVPPLISIVFYYRECISRTTSRDSQKSDPS